MIAQMLEKLQHAGIDCVITLLNESRQRTPAQMVFNPMMSSLFLTTKHSAPPPVGSLIKIDCEEAIVFGEINAHYMEEACSPIIRMKIEHWVPHNIPAQDKAASISGYVAATTDWPIDPSSSTLE